jgi:hypothetical protein
MKKDLLPSFENRNLKHNLNLENPSCGEDQQSSSVYLKYFSSARGVDKKQFEENRLKNMMYRERTLNQKIQFGDYLIDKEVLKNTI